MRLYIGSSDRTKAQEAGALLAGVHGHELTSRWFDEKKPKANDVNGWTRRAADNFAAIDRAEAVVAIFTGKWPGPGVHAEVGFALGRGLPVVVFAAALPTPMMRHPLVSHVTTADELEVMVKQLAVVAAGKPTTARKRTTKAKQQAGDRAAG